MSVFALVLAVVVTIMLMTRELYLARERAIIIASIEALRTGFENARNSIRQSHEEIFLLQALLIERGIVLEHDIQSARKRLIEGPRKRAEEHEAISQHLGRSPEHLVLEDTEGKIH